MADQKPYIHDNPSSGIFKRKKGFTEPRVAPKRKPANKNKSSAISVEEIDRKRELLLEIYGPQEEAPVRTYRCQVIEDDVA